MLHEGRLELVARQALGLLTAAVIELTTWSMLMTAPS
jgi:hypothetical protein